MAHLLTLFGIAAILACCYLAFAALFGFFAESKYSFGARLFSAALILAVASAIIRRIRKL